MKYNSFKKRNRWRSVWKFWYNFLPPSPGCLLHSWRGQDRQWNQGIYSHKHLFLIYRFVFKILSRLCHELSYFLSPFCFVIFESLDLFGLMNTVPSFAFIMKNININDLVYIKYLGHGGHKININFLLSAWAPEPHATSQ